MTLIDDTITAAHCATGAGGSAPASELDVAAALPADPGIGANQHLWPNRAVEAALVQARLDPTRANWSKGTWGSNAWAKGTWGKGTWGKGTWGAAHSRRCAVGARHLERAHVPGGRPRAAALARCQISDVRLKSFKREADATGDGHSRSSQKADHHRTGVVAERRHRNGGCRCCTSPGSAHLDPILGPDVGWWWALGIMVFVTERWPVELEFRRSTHSFSLTDIPLTLALIFTSGTHAFVAVMAGALVALLLRRASAVKFAFNLAQFALVTSVLIVIVHLAASTDPGFGWITWGAVLAAAQIGSVLTTAQILAAIVLTSGHVSGHQVREMFGLDHAVTVVGTAIALLCGIVWIERPEATPLLLIPILIAFIGYRAYVQEREGHEKVKTLYEANRTLSESPEVAVALEGLLERALEAFHAEQAEVILFAADGGAPLRTSLGPGAARETMAPLDAAAAAALRTCAADSDAAIALLAPFPPTLDPYLQYRGVRHGMLGVLRGQDRVIGTIMLANRFGLARGFTDGDLALFEILAANASAALQYDGLEHAVSELHNLQDQLQHQARHDPLTGLATRELFSQRVREALEPGTPGEVAVMVIDLDDFKVRQRDARASDRRRATPRGRLAAHERWRLRRRRRTTRRRRVRRPRPPPVRHRTPCRRPRRAHDAVVRPAGHRRRRAAPRRPQHRSRHEPPLARQRRGTAVERQRGHVRREGRRQASLLTVHARDARLGRPPPRPQGRARASDRAARARRPVPADRRSRHWKDRLRRGARALEPSEPWPYPPDRVHSARGRHGPDRAARPLRAGGGVHARRASATPGSRCRSTCRRSSSSSPTCSRRSRT